MTTTIALSGLSKATISIEESVLVASTLTHTDPGRTNLLKNRNWIELKEISIFLKFKIDTINTLKNMEIHNMHKNVIRQHIFG